MKKLRMYFAVLLILALVGSSLVACSNNAQPGAIEAAQAELTEAIADLTAAQGKIEQLEADLAEAQVYDASHFTTWFEEEGTWRSVLLSDPAANQPAAFVADASGAPTEEDLKDILHMASLAVTSGGRTDWFMVAVTDPEEQLAIIGTNDGVPKGTSEGTVTVLIFSERVLRQEFRTDEHVAFQPDRGYYDAGIVTGYLNTAAIAKGYGTHMFMTPALEGVNGFNEGGPGLDCAKYLEGTTYINGTTKEAYSTENMKYVNAVVIGTPDETIENGVTNKLFPDNWIIWGN